MCQLCRRSLRDVSTVQEESKREVSCQRTCMQSSLHDLFSIKNNTTHVKRDSTRELHSS
jgi:hypothetical protein